MSLYEETLDDSILELLLREDMADAVDILADKHARFAAQAKIDGNDELYNNLAKTVKYGVDTAEKIRENKKKEEEKSKKEKEKKEEQRKKDDQKYYDILNGKRSPVNGSIRSKITNKVKQGYKYAKEKGKQGWEFAKKNPGKVAAGAAVAGGIGFGIKKFLDRRKTREYAEHIASQPKGFIARKIAALRSIYSTYLYRARVAKSYGQASIFQKIASAILGVIDFLLEKLENLAG